MIEHMQYGYGYDNLGSPQLSLQVPSSTWRELFPGRTDGSQGRARVVPHSRYLGQLRQRSNGLIELTERPNSSIGLTVRAARFAGIPNKENWLHKLVALFDVIEQQTDEHHQSDPDLRLCYAPYPEKMTGQMASSMALRLPEHITERQVGEASDFMRDMATAMGYEAPISQIDCVFNRPPYALAFRAGYKRSLADGRQYFGVSYDELECAPPDTEQLQLRSHGIMSHEQQIICAAGAVALTRSA